MGRIRVNRFSESAFTVPHQFHSDAQWCTAYRQHRPEGFSQRMDIDSAAVIILEGNPGRFQILLERWHSRDETPKHEFIRHHDFRLKILERCHQFGAQVMDGGCP